MSDQPWQTPFGPHGPKLDVPSTMPNPTEPTPQPSFGTAEASWPVATAPSGGGGATFAPGVMGDVLEALSTAPIRGWMRNLAIVGGTLGCLGGLGRALLLHLPPAAMGLEIARLGIAGAAAGAGFPPAIRAGILAVRSAVWITLALALWALAIGASDSRAWIARLFQ